MATKLFRFSIQSIKSFKTNSLKEKTKLRIEDFEVPERYKGKIVEKWLLYWKGLCIDYRDVLYDVLKSMKEKPIRASTYSTIGIGSIYCAKNNPNENDFRDTVLHHVNDMVLVNETCHNPQSAQYLMFLEKCTNAGIIRRMNLGICSLLWLDNYDEACKLYKATCTYTKLDYLSLKDRIIDVGFVGKWWKLNENMIDYDINENSL